MLVTSEFLKKFLACPKGLAKFNDIFPDGCDSSSVDNIRLAIVGGLDVEWAIVTCPQIFDTEDVVCELLAHYWYLIQNVRIPITGKMVDIALGKSINAFPSIPGRLQTEELICRVLASNGKYLKYVRLTITKKMVDIALANTTYALPYVPKAFLP